MIQASSASSRPPKEKMTPPTAEYRTADEGYFRASGIPLLKGREFSATDQKSSEKVAILNKTLADRLFADVDPIGRRVANERRPVVRCNPVVTADTVWTCLPGRDVRVLRYRGSRAAPWPARAIRRAPNHVRMLRATAVRDVPSTPP